VAGCVSEEVEQGVGGGGMCGEGQVGVEEVEQLGRRESGALAGELEVALELLLSNSAV
jgi:hypothetical protein